MNIVKFLAAAVAVIAAAVYSGEASALSCPACTTYDLVMTPVFGDTGGTGTLVLDGTSGHDVLGLDLTFDLPNGKERSFDFSKSSLKDATATIAGGVLTSLSAHDIGAHVDVWFFDLGHSVDMIFLDFKNPFFDSLDHVTSGQLSSADPSLTPLPATWSMMLLGLSALGFFAWRRKSSIKSVATTA